MTADEILSSIAPQFDADPVRSNHIALAILRTSPDAFGVEKNDYAVALRAAHTLTLKELSKNYPGASGAIGDMHEGEQNISFMRGRNEDEYLSLTNFGRDLLDLIQGSIVPLDLVNRYATTRASAMFDI